MTEQDEAIRQLKQGDTAGLATLVRLHELKALRTVYGILGDRLAAEDVVADAFLAVISGIAGFDPARPFEAWFYRLVVNRAIDQRRRARRSVGLVQRLRPRPDPSTDLDA